MFARVLTFGIAVRIVIFIFAIIHPISNQDGNGVSPILLQTGNDFSYFRLSADLIESGSLDVIFDKYVAFYSVPFETQGTSEFGHQEGGIPVFPLMLIVTNYAEGNTLPLALVFLALSVGTLFLWLKWLHEQGVAPFFLLGFALLPNPVWFMLNTSSDLPFTFMVAVFYLTYFRNNWSRLDVIIWVTAMVLLPLTRAAGYSIVLFVFLDLLFRNYPARLKLTSLALTGVLVLLFGVVLYPDFITVVGQHGGGDSAYRYFNLTRLEYFGGLFDQLPVVLDKTLSWLFLLGAKLLYFVGLRPSYGDTSMWMVVVRGAAGLILLPGLVWLALKADNRNRLFMAAMVGPVMLGASQDRYNLPIMPILFFYGWLFVAPAWNRYFSQKAPAAEH
jgi:hypothetical protein